MASSIDFGSISKWVCTEHNFSNLNRLASAKIFVAGKVGNFVDVFVVMLVCGARQLVNVAVLQSCAETTRNLWNLCLLPIFQAILQQINALAVLLKGTS